MLPPRPSLVRAAGVLLASFALAAGGVPAGATAPGPGASGAGDAYFPDDGNGGINVRHYRIHDRYRFRGGRLSGRTALTVRATQDLSSFNLDFLLPVHGVRVDGVRARHQRSSRHEVTITPRTPVAAGEVFRVRVSYSGRPGRFTWDGESNWLANRHEVVAMNQPHMAPWWFPSSDHPSDKARMDLSITVPRGKQVLANGRPVSRRRHGDLVTHHWRADEPMATYLAMFAAGSFHVERGVHQGLPWRIAVSTRSLNPKASLALLRRTPRVIAALERDLGRYPFSTSGGLVTSLPVWFALENQTMPTYPDVAGGAISLIVHEQAHQWFGDSVALRRWRDIWLNEGAATFMEVRYAGRHGGESAGAWLRRKYDAAKAGDMFWNLAIGDPGPERIFAGPVYTRGAMTFQALRNRIGDEEFWTLVRRWLQENRNGHGSTTAFRAMAEDVSAQDLDGFFAAWLGSGRPADTAANGLG